MYCGRCNALDLNLHVTGLCASCWNKLFVSVEDSGFYMLADKTKEEMEAAPHEMFIQLPFGIVRNYQVVEANLMEAAVTASEWAVWLTKFATEQEINKRAIRDTDLYLDEDGNFHSGNTIE